jgi:hypothetical protein
VCFYDACPFRALARQDARAFAIYRWAFDSGSLSRRDEKKRLFPDDPKSSTVEVTRYYFNLKMHRHALRAHLIPRKLWLDVMQWVSLVASEANRDAGDEDEAAMFRAIRQRQSLRGW